MDMDCYVFMVGKDLYLYIYICMYTCVCVLVYIVGLGW